MISQSSSCRRCLLCLVWCLAAVCWASALAGQKTDVITLRNGNTITGEIKRLDRGKLDYSTDDMGTISVKWDKILEITSVHFFEVEVSSGRRIFGTLPASGEVGKMVVFLSDQDTLDMIDVVRMTPIETSFWDRTSGYVDLGFNLTRANDQTEWTLKGQFQYRGRRLGATLEASSYFRFQNGERNTSRNSAGVALERYLPKALSVVAPIQVEQNAELGLALRIYGGVGPARYFIRTQRVALQGAASLTAQREQYTSSDTAVVSLELLFAGDLDVFRYDSPKLDFTLKPNLFASLTQIGRFRAQVELRSRYELFSDFYVGLTAFYTGDTDPPQAGAGKDDYGVNFTLGWSWS